MLERIKNLLRIDSSDLDDEIIDLIEACKLDMKTRGIMKLNSEDALIFRAISIYCKAYFGYADKDYEKYIKSYEALRDHISMCGEYRVSENEWVKSQNNHTETYRI